MIAVDTKGRKLTIEGINMQTKHVKPMKGTRPAHALMRLLPRTHGPASLRQVLGVQPLTHARVAAAARGCSL